MIVKVVINNESNNLLGEEKRTSYTFIVVFFLNLQ